MDKLGFHSKQPSSGWPSGRRMLLAFGRLLLAQARRRGGMLSARPGASGANALDPRQRLQSPHILRRAQCGTGAQQRGGACGDAPTEGLFGG